MKVLAVCGFGCGSSMILRMTLEKVCAQLGVSCEVEASDINTARSTPCDAIFTSHELADELRSSVQVPIYSVKRYMDAEEVKTVFEEFLKDRQA